MADPLLVRYGAKQPKTGDDVSLRDRAKKAASRRSAPPPRPAPRPASASAPEPPAPAEPPAAPGPPAPALPRLISLESDPAYLALSDRLQFLEEDAGRLAALRRSSLGASEATSLEDLLTAGVRQREGIEGAQESRGLLRSGITEKMIAEQRGEESRLSAHVREQTARQLNELESGLAARTGELQRHRAGALTQARQQIEEGEQAAALRQEFNRRLAEFMAQSGLG